MSWNYNRLDVGTPATFMDSWSEAGNSKGRLRIGYLSSDLREHAVGYLMTEVFALHDRSKVEVFALLLRPGVPRPAASALQEYRRPLGFPRRYGRCGGRPADSRRWHTDPCRSERGYTREARLKLVAMRPAPVIVNWLGYPGTMASPLSPLHYRRRLDHSRGQRGLLFREGFEIATVINPACAIVPWRPRDRAGVTLGFPITEWSTAVSMERTNSADPPSNAG